MIFNNVLLPHPEGPIIVRNSPLSTSRLMLFNASVSTVSVRYVFSMFCNRIMLFGFIYTLFFHSFQNQIKTGTGAHNRHPNNPEAQKYNPALPGPFPGMQC